MTRDYIAGIVLSGLLHGGLVFVDRFFTPVVTPPKVEEEVRQFLDIIPKPPEEEPEPVDVPEKSDPAPAPAPLISRLAETFSTVDIDVIQQRAQPIGPDVLIRTEGVVIPADVGRPGKPERDGKGIFTLDLLDTPPSAKFQSKPVYPFEMRRASIEGSVIVGFLVDPSGDVRDAYAIRSNMREFEAAAVQAVSKWKFKAGRKDGRAVTTRMQVPIVFSITED